MKITNFSRKNIMECYRGSIAHGLYLDPEEEFGTDDIDKLMVFVYPEDYYLSLYGYLRKGDVFEEKTGESDIVGYELRKMFYLLSKSNPNVLLTLWLKKEHYLTLTPAWKEVIKNRDLFLSKEGIYKTFLGYARSQLEKMEHFEKQGYMGEKRAKLVEKFGYDTKNASHLIRLLKMGIEALEMGELKVFRDRDRDELLAIKKGELSLEEVKKKADKLFKKLESAYSDSRLSEKVDAKKVDILLLRVMDLARCSQKEEAKESADLNVINGKNNSINYAFIDSRNTYLEVQDGHGWKLDFGKFRVYLKDKYKVQKAFLFIGYVAGNERLYTYLQEAGYIVIFKPTLEYKQGGKVKVKGNVDAELVLHTMIEYENFGKAIIVSGDGDFHCLVEYLVEKGKFLKLIVPNRFGFSALLRKFMRYVVFLNDLRQKVARNKKRGISLRTKP